MLSEHVRNATTWAWRGIVTVMLIDHIGEGNDLLADFLWGIFFTLLALYIVSFAFRNWFKNQSRSFRKYTALGAWIASIVMMVAFVAVIVITTGPIRIHTYLIGAIVATILTMFLAPVSALFFYEKEEEPEEALY